MTTSEPDLLDHIAHLARTQRGPLAAIARAEGLGAEDAVDAVQDALATLLVLDQRPGSTMPRFDAPSSEWEPFLGTLVRNAARNKRRRHFLSRSHAPLEGPDASVEGLFLADTRPEADAELERAEEHVRLRGCVAELCDTQRAVVSLRMLEERAGEDVARALGISPGHVAVLLHRAKASLRACMAS